MNLLVKLTTIVHNNKLKASESVETSPSNLKIECMPTSSSKTISKNNDNSINKYPGAAVFLNLHQPRWFQRRYSMMIQNVINNIPDEWVVQIFWTAEGQSKSGIDINRGGLQRFIDAGKLIFTTIPKEILSVKKKKYELMVEPWYILLLLLLLLLFS
jgi:hypothetical protein